jgi:hypothetical protein
VLGQGEASAGTQTQVHLYTVLNWGLLLLDAAVGVAILVVRWRRQTTVRPRHVSLEAPPPTFAASRQG